MHTLQPRRMAVTTEALTRKIEMSKLTQCVAATILALMCAAPLAVMAQSHSNPLSQDDWPYYGHDAGGMRYSPLAQINRENVATLKVAWTFHVADISDGSGGKKRSGLETTPILVDGTLYLTTGFNRVFALDPETGKLRWVYDPMIELGGIPVFVASRFRGGNHG